MATIPFTSNKKFSIGVEIEFQLLDPATLDLTPKCPELLQQVPPSQKYNFKTEFIQSMIEIATNKCSNINEIADNLDSLTTDLSNFCQATDCLPYAASLHPFATLNQRNISNNPRYHQIMEELQIVGKRLITQGLHIHIGLPDAATAIHVNNAIRKYLPVLLALTASSPFYLDEDTGFQSYRSKLFESLPRSGVPTYISNWQQFEKCIALLRYSGAINSVKEIWWDVRPHPQLGTIEIRICDLPSRLSEILGITTIVQALVATLAHKESTTDDDYNIILNNKWQALRYGTKAQFIDDTMSTTKTVQQSYAELLEFIEPQMRALHSLKYCDAVSKIVTSGNSAERYRLLYEQSDKHTDCIKHIQGEFKS